MTSIESDLQKQSLLGPFLTSPIPTLLLGKGGIFLAANEAFEKDFMFKDIPKIQIISTDTKSSFELPVETLNGLIIGEQASFEYEGALGSNKWMRLTGWKIPFQQDAIVIIHIIDLTDNKNRQESYRNYQSIYRHNTDGIAIFDFDGRIVQVNPAFEKLFGYKESELIGLPFPVTPDLSKEEGEYILSETVKGNYLYCFETIRQHKNGQLLTVSITTSPIRDEQDQVYALTGIVRDITQQKLVLNKLDSFIENNMDPILIFDHNEKLIRVNKAFEETFGWTAKELIGTYVFEMPTIPSGWLTEVEHTRSTLVETSQTGRYETVRLRKDGTRLDVLLTYFPIKSQELLGWALILKDVSESKEKEKLMIQSEKLSIAGQLAAGIAHEIRNPLTSVKGFLQLIKAGQSKEDYYTIITSEFDRIELILSELLMLAKPQVRRLEKKSLHGVLKQVLILLLGQANLNNVEIVRDFDSDLFVVECDENQLKQVFINMIQNAIEAMPSGGKLIIEMKKQKEHWILVRFIDDGIGIPDDVLQRLGEPFYTTKDKGTGLGFMVSRNIIQQLGGTIRVQSQVNRGTTIDIELPLAEN